MTPQVWKLKTKPERIGFQRVSLATTSIGTDCNISYRASRVLRVIG